MPHEKAPLSKWCEGPSTRCVGVDFNCEKCKFTLKDEALKKKRHQEKERIKNG